MKSEIRCAILGGLFVFYCLFCLNVVAEDERLMIDVKINGKPVQLVFDTGAEASILLRSTAADLGLQITNSPDDSKPDPGKVRFDWTETCNLTFGDDTNICKIIFAVVDIPSHAQSQLKVRGAIAWSQFKQNMIRIDALNHEFRPLEQLPSEVSSWTKFKIQPDVMLLAWESPDQYGGMKSVFLDTGNPDGVNLSRQEWDEWMKAHPNAPKTIESGYTPGAGWVVTEVAWADRITFGPLVLTDVPITLANIEQISDPNEQEASLGLAALKRLDLIIDGNGGFVYVHPKKTPPGPCEHNRIGALFAPDDPEKSDVLRAHVVDGSPAYEAGIRNGDELLKIGGLDATKWRTDPVVMPIGRFWTQSPGTKVALKLRRGEKEFQTTVVLRNLIGPDVKNPAD